MTIKQASLGTLAKRRDARLKKLAQLQPFIAGLLAKVGVKCGNPNCKCASGERHEAWVLTRKERGKTVTVHVPRDMVEEVARWAAEYKRLKVLLREISELGEEAIRIFVKASRGAARNRRRAASTPAMLGGTPGTSTPIS